MKLLPLETKIDDSYSYEFINKYQSEYEELKKQEKVNIDIFLNEDPELNDIIRQATKPISPKSRFYTV